MTDLKPCPFCGSNKIRICVGTIDNGVPCDMDKPYYQVGCCACGCVVDNYDNRTKEDAIKAWNKRVGEVDWFQSLPTKDKEKIFKYISEKCLKCGEQK